MAEMPKVQGIEPGGTDRSAVGGAAADGRQAGIEFAALRQVLCGAAGAAGAELLEEVVRGRSL